MEDSLPTTRTSNLQLNRATKFLQKVSGFRGRIRFPGRRPKNSGDSVDDIGPYLRQTRSMDTNLMAKPYMSQPLLGLHNMDLRDNDENEDSERSASPGDTASRAGRLRLTSHRDKPLPRLSLGAEEFRYIDGLPPTLRSAQYTTSFILPSGSIATPILPPVPPKAPLHRPHTAGGPDFVGIPGKLLNRKPSKANVSESTTQSPPPSVAMAQVTGPSAPSRRPALRLDNLPTTPHRGINMMSDAASYGVARLSPTIISRPPPLPILNLPKLVVSSPESSSLARLPPEAGPSNPPTRTSTTRRADLRSMPALPLRGQDEPRDGDDDGDSDGEGDDDDDDEFHDAEAGHPLDDGEDGSETPIRRPRGSIDSLTSVISGVHISGEPGGQGGSSRFRYGTHLLPEVDTSRIDLSIFDDATVEPEETQSSKGKGKAREQWTPDPSDTPTPNRTSDTDYFSNPPQHAQALPQASQSLRTPRANSFKAAQDNASNPRPGIYKHASRSMIDLVSIANRNKPIREATNESDSFSAEEASQRPETIKGKNREGDDARSSSRPSSHTDERRNASPNRDKLSPPHHPLQRRRSMPTFSASTEPPPYPAFPPHPHHRPPVPSRDEVVEGTEHLPSYSNDIYLKAVMPRKLEFSKPGIMARDRKWRRVVCELEGTVFRVYSCPPELAGVSFIGGWWERKVGVGDVAEAGGASKTAGNTGGSSRLRKDEDKELLRVAKAEDEAASARVQTQVQVALPPEANIQLHQSHSNPPETDFHPEPPPSQPSSTTSKSRLNIVNHLLKPRSHSRSQSDVPPSAVSRSVSNTPRSSLSLARPSTSSGSVSGASMNPAGDVSATVSIPSASSTRSHFRHGSSSNSTFIGQTPADGNHSERRTSDLHLLRAYTMQNAESGLGNDYVKRRNVIRVRMEGEQFLLQAKDMTDVVAWIEGFQASTNIALDLDERVMPRGPLFPRRRRRRRREGTTQVAGSGGNANDAS